MRRFMAGPSHGRLGYDLGLKSPAMRPLLDRFVSLLVRVVLAIFFRRFEVAGQERIPAGRPLLFVANHGNSLLDPIVLLGAVPVAPRFLAASILWKNPFLRPFLALGGVIPVYRRKDEGSDPAKNAETFARCREHLAHGGAVALFPEGISHNLPSLQPLKTGAARIALETEEAFPGLRLALVPVGLFFEEKGRFRSRALVEIGEPIDPAPEVALFLSGAGPVGEAPSAAEVEAVHRLTARLDAALKSVTLNYGSWEEARLLARAAELFAPRDRALPGATDLAEAFPLHRALLDGHEWLEEHHPEKTAAASRAVEAYDRLLQALRLRDDQVVADYPLSPALGFVARSLLFLFIQLPLAAVGTLLNWPTYRLVGAVAQRLVKEADTVSTYKLFAGFFFFPATWLLEGALVTWLTGHLWMGLATVVLAPMTGHSALFFAERASLLAQEARAFLLLKTRDRTREMLRERRGEALAAVEELAGLYGGREPAQGKVSSGVSGL